jgi:hypothetical protein
MEIIYSGQEVKKYLAESIPGYKPRLGNNTSSAENEKINKKSNKDSINNVELAKPKEELAPVKLSGQSTDLGNNKNMLDIQFSYDPGKEYIDRVKKQVTGEDSEFGNKPNDANSNKVNKAFYDAAKKATDDVIGTKNELENSGIVGKAMPIQTKGSPFSRPGKPKKGSPNFVSETNAKLKKLNFKNTHFLNEKHMFSLIPEDYKKNENMFVMQDMIGEEYVIGWKIDEKTNISEGNIVSHQNKKKTQEEFNRMKDLYSYNSKDHTGNLKNSEKEKENYDVISESIKKLKEVSDN